ncbi:hypothetical protein ZPR_1540 [Zunongwangia profunda SM-A87]|uniref:Uncharacterized protein n=1 Tax=Zunongwangia profunda (strain DSM 18752 / CCTCC AB 206139 / SM-A87) TaxID=655815 RepID=D5BKX6_ZUNPS|nr:hypothetical protein ZPR_1540 [Zunongwangia profunda SM-A87]
MEWSGRVIIPTQPPKGELVSILVFQWNGLEVPKAW